MSRLFAATLTLAMAAACQAPSPTQAKPSAGEPVARWNGGAISANELDAQLYEQRKQVLEQLVFRKLVEQKAKAEKVTPEELVKREVTEKVPKPSEAEMKQFYDDQAKRNPPYEQVKDQIAQFMQRPALQKAQQAFVEQLKKEFAVVVALKPPRFEVAAEGQEKGAKAAPVTIVEFSDFQCPFCSRAEETIAKVMKEYDGKVRLVYRDFPLPFHPQAQKAAEAAQCAADQGKYWPMHEKLFASQQALDPSALKGYAKELGLDEAKFGKCLDSGEKAKMIEASKQAGEKVGVTGTPAFFVNGYQLTGAQPFEEFKTIIDGELAAK